MNTLDRVSELLNKLGVELSADQTQQLAEFVGEEEAASVKAARLQNQLRELNEKYAAVTEMYAVKEADLAAEKLLSGYRFASERVRDSVLAEVKGKGFRYEGGELVGGREFLEELKTNEPDVFAREPQGLFMGSTRGNVSADADNLETQIFGGFGLTK